MRKDSVKSRLPQDYNQGTSLYCWSTVRLRNQFSTKKKVMGHFFSLGTWYSISMIKFFFTTGRYPCSRKTERKKNNFIIPFNYSAIAAKETTWYLFAQLLLSVAIIWLFFLFDLFKRILESVNLSWNIWRLQLRFFLNVVFSVVQSLSFMAWRPLARYVIQIFILAI